MRLGLSSAAAPDATLDDLLEACARRGLTGLELRDRDAHGVGGPSWSTDGMAVVRRAAGAGVVITAFRTRSDGVDVEHAARQARLLDTTLIVDRIASPEIVLRTADRLRTGGAEVAVAIRGDVPEIVIRDLVSAGIVVAWDAEPAAGAVGRTAARLLELAGDRLRHIRILGGGPETAIYEGRGIGELMARLALGRFAGSLVLAPSTSRYRVAWDTWLGRRGGSGCGSKTSDPSLVSLDAAPPA